MNNEERPQQPMPKQSIYPDPDAIKQKWQQPPATNPALVKEAEYSKASSDFRDLLVLASGVGSAIMLVGLPYLLKNIWATTILVALLALTCIVLSLRNYKAGHLLTPLTVVGLSAATVALVYIANIVIANLVLRSTLDSLY